MKSLLALIASRSVRSSGKTLFVVRVLQQIYPDSRIGGLIENIEKLRVVIRREVGPVSLRGEKGKVRGVAHIWLRSFRMTNNSSLTT